MKVRPGSSFVWHRLTQLCLLSSLLALNQMAKASQIDSHELDLSSLYRVSTAPLSSATSNDRSTIAQARNVKLTKMGFAPNEQAMRSPPTQTKGFGGLNLKNIMQTFKGKA